MNRDEYILENHSLLAEKPPKSYVQAVIERIGNYLPSLAIILVSIGFTVSVIRAEYLSKCTASRSLRKKSDRDHIAIVCEICRERGLGLNILLCSEVIRGNGDESRKRMV